MPVPPPTPDDLPPLPRYLQLLWDQEPPGRRGPRRTRTIQEVGGAAVALADRSGLDAVSMKAVAGELGLTTMSLYRYVDSKDELSAVMLDLAFGEPDLAAVTTGPWRTRLEAWARGLVASCRRHPWSVDVVLTAPPLTPNALAWTDAGLRALADTRLTTQQRLSGLLALDGYVRNFVRSTRQLGLLPGEGETVSDEARRYSVRLAEVVDADRLPALAAAQSGFEDDEGEDFFETELAFGLSVFLDGLEQLERSAPENVENA
ncbi:TetR/AcrR family transcriptional regulator [Luteipulveratus flavus]|uniref:TetR/AcrR family transcriptional regulator n=1 Tax=Luteipulveratus flavus TaxID=3031728 RepID=A0ABT6C5V0_9MICO|nr:TetR/AcrR family transcriptional regulator [Luteipulveratus sp. YIM 133296]MDF8263938.1 TetR/AcrR family transcriptional regulator [Luteipulveratus sp. YIM 133296]